MKYYLVARSCCCMVGIEQCRGYSVGRSLQAAFEREFAGRILMVTSAPQSLPGIAYVAYKGASGPPSFEYCVSKTNGTLLHVKWLAVSNK